MTDPFGPRIKAALNEWRRSLGDMEATEADIEHAVSIVRREVAKGADVMVDHMASGARTWEEAVAILAMRPKLRREALEAIEPFIRRGIAAYETARRTQAVVAEDFEAEILGGADA